MVEFRAMVSHADSTLPRAMCTSRARDFHIPRSLLVCVLLLRLTLSAAHALDPSKRLTQYAHTAWRIQDGFFPNTPFWISQTKDGYLWVAGNSGALRFDGVRFTPWSIPIASTPGLHPLNVRAGEFWIAGRGEFAHIRDNVVISRYDLPGLDAINKDSDGSVWVLSYLDPARTLCQATDAKIRCFGKAEGITIHEVASFIPDGKGGFWIGGDTSLLHWKMGATPEIYSPRQLQSNVGQIGIHALLADSDGSLLVGIMAAGPGLGLERFRDGVFTPVVLPNFDGSKLTIEAMIEDSNKNVWIATYGNGIYRIHGQTVDHFGRAEGLSSDSVSDLYESDDGIIWAATSNGIDNFRDLPVTTFSTAEGLGRDGAISVIAAHDGTVWVANLGTLDFIRKGAASSVRVPGQQVSSLLEDHLGNIWVGVDDGLFLYKDGRFRRIPEPDHHPLGLVVGLTEDIDGNIWAECKGTQRRLIRIRDFKVREEFSESQVPKAKAIAADPKGGIWLGTLTGDLTFFRDGIAHTFPLNSKSKSWAYQIAVDSDGSVMAASDDGFVVLRAGKVQRLGKDNGLPCDGVNGFAVDDNKNLWLNTPCGFVEIASAEVQRWWMHPDTIVQARLFDALDGARPGRVSFNPAAKSPDGRLWFVNSVVLQMIDPSRLSGGGTVSPVYVESVVADRKQYKVQDGLQLPPLTRDLQIGYTSPSFLIPQKVKFRYRLDGHDRDWQDAGTRREAFYTDLSPGKYRFRVIACNNNGVWNEQGATLDFSVAPAYWQTNWFRALCVLTFVAMLWAVYQLRVRALKRRQAILEQHQTEILALNEQLIKAQEAERMRISGELHDGVLQQITSLTLRLGSVKRQLPPDLEAKVTLSGLQQELIRMGTDVRHLSHELHPALLHEAGLPAALSSYCEEFSKVRGLPVECETDESVKELSPGAALCLYRIAQEALGNAAKYSQAKKVQVRLIRSDGRISLSVSDDGVGCDVNELRKSGGLGVINMRERVHQLNGTFELNSEPRCGTRVKVEIPFPSAS